MGVDAEKFILEMIERLPKVNSVDATMVMRDIYETEYDIFKHVGVNNKNRPLASVAFHTAENINDNSLLEDSMRTYLNRGIKDKFGLSYIEFIELPSDVVAMMLSISEEGAAKNLSEINQLERELKNM